MPHHVKMMTLMRRLNNNRTIGKGLLFLCLIAIMVGVARMILTDHALMQLGILLIVIAMIALLTCMIYLILKDIHDMDFLPDDYRHLGMKTLLSLIYVIMWFTVSTAMWFVFSLPMGLATFGLYFAGMLMMLFWLRVDETQSAITEEKL